MANPVSLLRGWLNESNVKENLFKIVIQGKAKKCIYKPAKRPKFQR